MTTLSMLNMIPQFFRTIWLSVSSQDFYRDLYYMYKGYGLRYITLIISTTSIIYAILFMYDINLYRGYLENANSGNELNPIEFLLKDVPDMQYDGKNLTADDQTPTYIVSQTGVKIAVIDTAGHLNKDQSQKVSLVFARDKMIFWNKNIFTFNINTKDSKEDPESMVLEYDKIFGTESAIVDRDFIKASLLNMLNKVGILAFCISLPISILIYLTVHIASNIFLIIFLYCLLLGMRMKPTLQSASRIILFASGAAVIATPFLKLISPALLSLTTLIKYGTIFFAVYSISTHSRR